MRIQNKKKQRRALIHLTPANHLDLPAIIWLQSYLTNETDGQTIVVVSHDRNFLDAVTEETIIFRNQKLTYHPGNYDDWERNTEEQRKRKTRLKEVCFSFFMNDHRSLMIILKSSKKRGENKL